jgi:hypothetical protein
MVCTGRRADSGLRCPPAQPCARGLSRIWPIGRSRLQGSQARTSPPTSWIRSRTGASRRGRSPDNGMTVHSKKARIAMPLLPGKSRPRAPCLPPSPLTPHTPGEAIAHAGGRSAACPGEIACPMRSVALTGSGSITPCSGAPPVAGPARRGRSWQQPHVGRVRVVGVFVAYGPPCVIGHRRSRTHVSAGCVDRSALHENELVSPTRSRIAVSDTWPQLRFTCKFGIGSVVQRQGSSEARHGWHGVGARSCRRPATRPATARPATV